MTLTLTITRKKLAVLIAVVAALVLALVVSNGRTGSSRPHPSKSTALLDRIRLAASGTQFIFVQVSGFKDGESLDDKHPNIGEVNAVSSGWVNATASGSGATGGGTGKAKPSVVELKRLIDSYTTQFMNALTSGKKVATVRLFFSKPVNNSSEDWLIMTLTTVHVARDNLALDNDGARSENVQLAFAQMKLEYKLSNDQGTATKTETFCWNVPKNRVCT